MLKKRYTPIIFLLFFAWQSFGQERPSGKFLKDRIKVGEHVQYTLSLKYSSEKEVLFPDSSFNYFPFDYVEKRFFKTRTEGAFSIDSAVYTLASFETDTVQQLALPVFYINNGDSIKVSANPDKIILVPTVTVVADSVKLMQNTNYVKVDKQINYTDWFIGVFLFILIVIVFILSFGESIARKLKFRRLHRQHDKFVKNFASLTQGLGEENFQVKLQEIYTLWKKYLQQISNRPYSSYSTREITAIFKEEDLKNALMDIDRGIYAGKYSDNFAKNTATLSKYSEKAFKLKLSKEKYASTK